MHLNGAKKPQHTLLPRTVPVSKGIHHAPGEENNESPVLRLLNPAPSTDPDM